ncbi:CoA-binding protein [Bradyrhizobium sp. 174]|uniref:CoA-binding protein n=1 Tax=Bradyrhizobium sp. 174 TaxID=2782645 RepID=UPI001FFC1444|nr:CoA-binding protein [Bradyrhizobium sp. 174]MCK1574178.1 CoA-binding protein [Bradyrhizobium sp. 174]
MTVISNMHLIDPIDRLFRPESVPTVRASPKVAGSGISSTLAFSAELAAVNRRYEQVEGVLCFPSLTASPRPVGLVMVGIPSHAIPPVPDDCEIARVGAIQIISSGSADQRAERVVRQRRLVKPRLIDKNRPARVKFIPSRQIGLEKNRMRSPV